MHLFKKIKPALVICYLDWPNIIAGLGAVLAGVPHIVLSGRNVPPTHFPHFFDGHTDDFRLIYQILMRSPHVCLTNNSTTGAQEYAKWLGLKKSRVAFIPNCLAREFMASPPVRKVRDLRTRLGLKASDRVVLGVFRLAPEKRPEKFLAVFAQLAKKFPNLRAVICGIGKMREELDELVKKHKLQKHVIFVGVTGEIREMMNLADILLHTAAYEGMPNVMLEAQSQGLPIVCARVGGVLDSLAPELIPYSFAKNDWKGMTAAATKLLRQKALRRQVGVAAKTFARREFSLRKLIAHNLAIARIKPAPNTRRVRKTS